MKSGALGYRLSALTLAAAELTPTLLAQCAMCRASLAGAEGGEKVIAGFQQGIGFLLLVVVVICGLATNVLRAARKDFERNAAREPGFDLVASATFPADH